VDEEGLGLPVDMGGGQVDEEEDVQNRRAVSYTLEVDQTKTLQLL
jgi:hypothetical protein